MAGGGRRERGGGGVGEAGGCRAGQTRDAGRVEIESLSVSRDYCGRNLHHRRWSTACKRLYETFDGRSSRKKMLSAVRRVSSICRRRFTASCSE